MPHAESRERPIQYSPEIHDYFVNFCEKYNLRKYIKLEHKVVGAFWHEDCGQWEVRVEHLGQTITDWCDVLVNGSGLLNCWKCKLLSVSNPTASGQ